MINEHDLILRARNGDKAAFEEIISFYNKKIYSFIFNIVNNQNDAVDITQETFLKVFTGIESFDTKKNFVTWIYTIAKNCAISFLIKNQKYKLIEPEDNVLNCASNKYDDSNPESTFEKKEELLQLITLIEKLPEKYYKLIQMKYIFGLSYEEISNKLNIPVYKIESRLYIARKKLLKQITEYKNNSIEGSDKCEM